MLGILFKQPRVLHDDASPHPPAMVAAMMRPGAPSSMNVNDFHSSLGHANIKTLYEAAKQMGIKLTGIPFGYRRQALQRKVPTWGVGAITSSRPWSSTASSPGAAPEPLAAATSSRGGDFPAATPAASAAPRGGGIPPMSSSGAATTSAAAATSSRGGGIPAAVPAAEVTGDTHVSGSRVGPPAIVGATPTPPAPYPSVAAGTATGELSATGQGQMVTSGGRREVLAEVSRMAGGTSPVGPGASGPPDMVHDGGAGGRWQGQQVTPAVTRSRAKRDGLWPGIFALMATQEDIARSIAELSPPDVVEQEVPSDLTCDMETPETYVQAHTGPHSDIWTEAEGKELRGLNATGTFQANWSE